jgi:hypothetical protein
MNNSQQLRTIKLVHSLIWIFMVTVIFYVVYSGIFNAVNLYTWISIAIVLLEGLVLLFFKMSCPLTILARKYSDSTKDNFDIYLPNRIARYNKQIFTSIFIFGVILVISRSI